MYTMCIEEFLYKAIYTTNAKLQLDQKIFASYFKISKAILDKTFLCARYWTTILIKNIIDCCNMITK